MPESGGFSFPPEGVLGSPKMLAAVGALVVGLGTVPTSAVAAAIPASQTRERPAGVKKVSLSPRFKVAPAPNPGGPYGHLYRINWGDSLWSIANATQTTVAALEEVNQLSSTQILAGDYLVVPDIYTVQTGDTLSAIARRFNVPLLLLWHENRLASDLLQPGQQLVIPYMGAIPSGSYAGEPAASPAASAAPVFTANEVVLVAHLVQAEAGNQPFVGQVAVASVVLNRLRASGFPKSVEGVLFQPGQFESVSNGTFWQAPKPLAFMAAQAAINGWDPTDGALFYFNPALPHDSWMDSLPVSVVIGAQVFCR